MDNIIDSHLVEILARVRAEVRGLDDAGGHGDALGLEADWGGGGAGGGSGAGGVPAPAVCGVVGVQHPDVGVGAAARLLGEDEGEHAGAAQHQQQPHRHQQHLLQPAPPRPEAGVAHLQHNIFLHTRPNIFILDCSAPGS